MGSYKSFLEPRTCGFYRTAAFLAINKAEEKNDDDDENIPRTLAERHEEFCLVFEEDIEQKLFMASANRLKKVFQKWGKSKKDERAAYISKFHPKKYKNLPPNSKVGHTLENCIGCQDTSFLEMQSTFPVNVKAINHTKASKDNPFTAARVRISAGKENDIKEYTRKIYNVVNEPFEKTFGVSFAEGITGMKEIKIVKKPSAYEKKKEKRKIITQVKKNLERDWESIAVERYVPYIFLI